MRLFTIITSLLLALSVYPASAEQRSAFVRSDAVLEQYKEAQSAQTQLKQEVEGWQREAAEMEKELASLLEQYQGRSAMLSEEARSREQSVIERKRVALQEYADRYFDPRVGKAAQRQAELFQPIEEAILAAIRDVAQQESFDIVLDAATGAVLWGDGKYDLTDAVVSALNGSSDE